MKTAFFFLLFIANVVTVSLAESVGPIPSGQPTGSADSTISLNDLEKYWADFSCYRKEKGGEPTVKE
jgi:hypothetical protein